MLLSFANAVKHSCCEELAHYLNHVRQCAHVIRHTRPFGNGAQARRELLHWARMIQRDGRHWHSIFGLDWKEWVVTPTATQESKEEVIGAMLGISDDCDINDPPAVHLFSVISKLTAPEEKP